MSNNKPIILRALWKPTKEEAARLLEFEEAMTDKKILYVRGRQPVVSFMLCGRDPVDWIEAGETYFINLRSSLLGNRKTVRRVVNVYPFDLALPKELPVVDLAYLLRPITVLEAWRASREPVHIVRRYRTGKDEIRPIPGCDDFQVDLKTIEDQTWMGDLQFEWEEMQSRMDELDESTRDVKRPDWKLAAPLPRGRR